MDGFVKVTGDYTNGALLEYNRGSFNGIVFPSNRATVFIVPSKEKIATATEKDYAVILTENITDDREYNIDAYYFSKEHQNADVLVMYDAVDKMADISKEYNNTLCVYLGKVASVNEDNEDVTLIKYFDGKDVKKIPLAKGFTTFDSLVMGDVIRFTTNLYGEVSSGVVVYNNETLNAEVKDYNYSIRISGGYIASIRNNMLRVENKRGETEGSNILSLTGYPTTAEKIIVIEKENGRAFPRTGSTSDFAVGDYVIIQQRTGNVKSVIIFKENQN